MKLIRTIIQRYGYLVILLLALGIRSYRLDLVPVGVIHDEVHDLVNAKSLALTGKSAPGTVAGIVTGSGFCDGNCIFGELVSYLLIPWMWVAPLGIIWSKIPFLGASLAIVYFGGKLFENLSGKKGVGMITAMLLAINPWAIHFGRSAFENLFTFGFYLMGLCYWTKKGIKTRDLIIGMGAMTGGFLSYMGAKPLFPLVIIWGISYVYFWSNYKNKKLLIGLGAVGLLMFGGYLWALPRSMAGQRLKEINYTAYKGAEEVTKRVDEERKVSLEMPLLRDWISNKFTVRVRSYVEKYVGAFDPKYIFWEGDEGYDVFDIPNNGYLYLIDGLMVVIGLVAMGVGIKKKAVWIIGLVAMMPVAAVISESGVTYALRSGLLYPILAGISGWGSWWAGKLLKKKYRMIFMSGMAGIYAISFAYFWIMYWYRGPFLRSSAWFFQERAAVRYAVLAKNGGGPSTGSGLEVVSKDPVDWALTYGFYTGKYNNKQFIEETKKTMKENDYVIDGIRVSRVCPEKYDEKKLYIVDYGLDCIKEPKGMATIGEPRDGGSQFLLINDGLCEGIKLGTFPYPRKAEDFEVEKMNKTEFCQKWVSWRY